MRGQRIHKDMSRDLVLCVGEGAENMLLWFYVLMRGKENYYARN